MTETQEVIKGIEDGRPTAEGGYTIRLSLQNGDYHDIDLSAVSSIDEDGCKDYRVEVEAS